MIRIRQQHPVRGYRIGGWSSFVCILGLICGGCGGEQSPAATATPTVVVIATATVATPSTATVAPSTSPTRTRTRTPNASSPTATLRATAPPATIPPTQTATAVSPTPTTRNTVPPTPSATSTATSTHAASHSPTASATPTSEASFTAVPTATVTSTSSPTASPTATIAATATATATGTVTATGTPTTGSVVSDQCGDGIAESWDEECDDGNRTGGDGCSADCLLEPGGDPCAGIPQRSADQLQIERVASGISRPVSLRAAPGDVNRLFVVEQRGRIRIIKKGVLLSMPFLDLSSKVTLGTELGMLSMAFHPDYERNGIFFVYYLDTPGSGLRSVVSRFHVSADPDIADAASERIILQQPQPWNVHKGGDLFFGLDGLLYVPFGDGGLSISQQDNGQQLNTWLAKILRIDVDAADPYAVPPDNPFVQEDTARHEIWAMGLRNPWRVSQDRATGNIFIGDVGEQRIEEIDVVPVGASGFNFGWPRVEGQMCTRTPCNPNAYAKPVAEYPHADGTCSVIGGYVYRGCAMPALHGAYFHSDFCAGFVKSFVYEGGVATQPRDWTAMLQPGERQLTAISSFGQDARGELYICDLDGEVFKIASAVP